MIWIKQVTWNSQRFLFYKHFVGRWQNSLFSSSRWHSAHPSPHGLGQNTLPTLTRHPLSKCNTQRSENKEIWKSGWNMCMKTWRCDLSSLTCSVDVNHRIFHHLGQSCPYKNHTVNQGLMINQICAHTYPSLNHFTQLYLYVISGSVPDILVEFLPPLRLMWLMHLLYLFMWDAPLYRPWPCIVNILQKLWLRRA